MDENSRVFVGKDGRVIRPQQIEEEPPSQSQSTGAAESRRVYAEHEHRQPARGIPGNTRHNRDMPRQYRIDMPTLAASILLVIVCAFVVLLAVAGIRGASQWAFGGNKGKGLVVESSHSNIGGATSQKPILAPAPGRTDAHIGANSMSGNVAQRSQAESMTGKPAEKIRVQTPAVDQKRKRVELSSHRGHKPLETYADADSEVAEAYREEYSHPQAERPRISREPVVDYQSSIREMEIALENKWEQMRNLADELER